MLKWYGYLGLILILLTEANFYAKIQPFADWYVVIVWIGYILLVDSLVYMVKGKSLITHYPTEFAFLLFLSVPFWLIFEFYNLFTVSWIYTNYLWYVHPFDFATIMPAVLETFTLVNAVGLWKGLDKARKKVSGAVARRWNSQFYRNMIKLLAAIGAFAVVVPIIFPAIGFPFMWFGLFLLLDPLNYLVGRPSVIRRAAQGYWSIVPRLFLSGVIMGFFWELWNYQAYPQWHYNIAVVFAGTKLFEMPILGYLGYMPFAMEVFLFFALFRSFIFKKGNGLLSI